MLIRSPTPTSWPPRPCAVLCRVQWGRAGGLIQTLHPARPLDLPISQCPAPQTAVSPQFLSEPFVPSLGSLLLVDQQSHCSDQISQPGHSPALWLPEQGSNKSMVLAVIWWRRQARNLWCILVACGSLHQAL